MGMRSEGRVWGSSHRSQDSCWHFGWDTEEPWESGPVLCSHPHPMCSSQGMTPQPGAHTYIQGRPGRFTIRCSTVIMLELGNLHFFAPNQKTLFSAYRVGIMYVEAGWHLKLKIIMTVQHKLYSEVKRIVLEILCWFHSECSENHPHRNTICW